MWTRLSIPVIAMLLLLGAWSTPLHIAQAAPRSSPASSPTTQLAPAPVQVSSDPFSTPVPGYHHSEVETSSASQGTTEVAAFQVGRIYDGGAAAIGWATRRGGAWQHGLLPGLTKSTTPAGPYDRATDASVAYDAAHSVWLVSSLAMAGSGNALSGVAVTVNRSADGIHWTASTVVARATGQDFDKNWTSCDNWKRSPYYGHCYTEWDDNGANDLILMSTSTDGGQTWSTPVEPAGAPRGLGGEPVVQPNGRVIVPALSGYENAILAYSSSDGGRSWTNLVTVDTVRWHFSAANFRGAPLPTVAADAAGKVYVMWQDCRFETYCAANDIVMSSSTDGIHWTPTVRIPLDGVGAGVDHFLPGLAVQAWTSGASGRLALIYDYYLNTACTASTCRLYVGYANSINGGQTWSAPSTLAGPMQIGWLAPTSDGAMVGDYNTMSFLGGQAIPVYVVARPPNAGGLNEFAATTALLLTGGSRVARSAGVAPSDRLSSVHTMPLRTR